MKVAMDKAVLCEYCKYGFNSYLLDNINPFCKYKRLHDGKHCRAFKRYANMRK